MRHIFRSVSAIAMLLTSSHFALAEATDEGATKLEGVFRAYLGDNENVVSVETDGDNYKVTIDLASLADKAKMDGSKFEMSPIQLTVHDNGGGKWQVSKDGPLNILVDVPNALHLEGGSADYSLTGVFDEALGTFASATVNTSKFTMNEAFTDPKTSAKASALVDIADSKTEINATANPTGGVNSDIKVSTGAFSETIDSAANEDTHSPAFNIKLNAQSSEMGLNGKGVRHKSILDLAAFFVAHQDKDSIVKAQNELKGILTSALPLWDNMAGTTTLKTVKITTPMGDVGADQLDATLDMNGAVKDGKFGEKLSFTGLSLPAGIIPPWANTLVPKALSFDVVASGFNLAEPAGKMVSTMDLSQDKPLSDEFMATLMPIFLPKGTTTISLNKTGVSNDTYDLKADASFEVGPAAQPTGKATISLKGLDEIMKAVQAAPPEAGLQSGAAVVVVAKGLAKTGADGALTWDVESTADGKVLVNGTDVNKLK